MAVKVILDKGRTNVNKKLATHRTQSGILLIGDPQSYYHTMFICQCEEPSGFIYPSIKSWNNPGNI